MVREGLELKIICKNLGGNPFEIKSMSQNKKHSENRKKTKSPIKKFTLNKKLFHLLYLLSQNIVWNNH